MNRHMHTPHAIQQRGAVLVVALIFLVILGLIGISVAQNNMLEERMTGNTRNRDLAFQAAEAALKHAGKYLTTYASETNWNGTAAGLVAYSPTDSNDAEYWRSYGWASVRNPDNISTLSTNNQPRYIVQKLPDKASTNYFRVTAMGLSGDNSAYDPTKSQNKAVVILQAVYCYNAGGGTCS